MQSSGCHRHQRRKRAQMGAASMGTTESHSRLPPQCLCSPWPATLRVQQYWGLVDGYLDIRDHIFIFLIYFYFLKKAQYTMIRDKFTLSHRDKTLNPPRFWKPANSSIHCQILPEIYLCKYYCKLSFSFALPCFYTTMENLTGENVC